MSNQCNCNYNESKNFLCRQLVNEASMSIEKGDSQKINAIWIEASGCSGNIISYLDADEPDILYTINNIINLKYENSIMASQGEKAFQNILKTLNTEFVLIVEGAVSTGENGLFNIVASYKGKDITGKELIQMTAPKAKYVIAMGTCASYGGISAAFPNPSSCISVHDFIKREVINLPGCPCHPDWLSGTLSSIVLFGKPELDSEGRPVMFYGSTIHDNCPRRSYFDKGIYAKKLGDKECMFKLGCRGPVTRTDCPIRRWNDRLNWPIGDNTPCIGCAHSGFPDKMEPFIRY